MADADWHRAEDHAQVALTKLYLAWRRIDRHVVIGVRNEHWPCVPATRWG